MDIIPSEKWGKEHGEGFPGKPGRASQHHCCLGAGGGTQGHCSPPTTPPRSLFKASAANLEGFGAGGIQSSLCLGKSFAGRALEIPISPSPPFFLRSFEGRATRRGQTPAPHIVPWAHEAPPTLGTPPVPVWVLGFARGPEVPDAVTCSRGGPWERQPGLCRNLGLLK